MSEVIESYIRRHPELSEKDAFEGFLNEDRIKAWIGTDETRKDRLRKEFGRVWGSMHVAGQVSGGPRSGPTGPAAMQQPRTLRVEVTPEAAHADAPRAPIASGGRKLQVMCTNCYKVSVWMTGDVIQCRTCGHAYDDMLQLIRVTPVGPFEFLFGEGWKGAATGAAIAAGLVGVYFLLRWL